MHKNLYGFFLRFVTMHEFDRQTDRRTEFLSLDCVCISCSAVKLAATHFAALHGMSARTIAMRKVSVRPSVCL